MRREVQVGWLVVVMLGALGCAPRSAYDVQRSNPLGPSFWVVPTPSEDAALLGRTFLRAPDTALSLEEQSRANPCEPQLSPASAAEMSNHYEKAIEVSSSAHGQALLGLYGFSADASSASHLLYKVDTTKKLTRLDTTAYVSCCAAQDCGWGYVSALIYGEGEYVSAQQASGSAAGSYQLVTIQGDSSYKALNKKRIRGWLAAVITAHDRAAAAQACAPNEQWAGYECVSKDMIPTVREVCAVDDSSDPFWKGSPNMQHNLRERQAQACRWLDEHGLPRPASAPSTPAASESGSAP